jgi:glycosyltransferase involved in cell wall biosynthesis
MNWPLVSILTPSFNSAAFIEETIQSVLTQDYPYIEHIIVDGGSTDGTVEILQKYPHLKWISEPDRGQSDALNKAFAMSKGEIIGWLNADDLYEPGAITQVVRHILEHPSTNVVYGHCKIFDSDGSVSKYYNTSYDHQKLLAPWRGFHGAFQPSIFYKREVIERVGGWDSDLHFVMDYDLLLRISEFDALDYLDVDLSRFRRHPAQKGALAWHKFVYEFMIAIERYWRSKNRIRYIKYRLQVRHFYALALLKEILEGTLSDRAQEEKYLLRALQFAPTVLYYPWVFRRLVQVCVGQKWTGRAKAMLDQIRSIRCV